MGESHTEGARVVALGVLSFTSVPVIGAAGYPWGELSPSSHSLVPALHPFVFLALNPCAPPCLGSRKGDNGCRRGKGALPCPGHPHRCQWDMQGSHVGGSTCSPSMLLGPGETGRGEGVQVGARAEPATWGLGKPQDCLSLRDWRLAWKGQREDEVRYQGHEQGPMLGPAVAVAPQG